MDGKDELLEQLRQLNAVWQETKLRTPLQALLFRSKSKMFTQVNQRNARLNKAVQIFYRKSYWKTPDFYSALESAATRSSVKLRIPETLLKLNSRGSLLTTDHYGIVQVDRSLDAEQQFFAMVHSRQKEITTLKSKRLPYYVHTHGNTVKLTMSASHAAEMSRSSGKELHMLQRYVPPQSSKVSKLRVHWRKDGNPLSYIVISKQDLYQSGDIDPLVRKEPYSLYAMSLPSSALSSLNVSIRTDKPGSSSTTHLQNLNTSSTSQLRSRSVPRRIGQVRPAKQEVRSIPEDGMSAWLVHSSDLKTASILENKSLASHVLGILSTVRRVAEQYLLKGQFNELLVDFMKDTDGRWMFLACKGLFPEEVPPESALLITEVPAEVELNRSRTPVRQNIFNEKTLGARSTSLLDQVEVEEKPRTFRSFYKLENEEHQQFTGFKEELIAKGKQLKNDSSFIDLLDIKLEGIKNYGTLMKRTKSGRIPPKMIRLEPAQGKTSTTQVINDIHPSTLLNLPQVDSTSKEFAVRRIMDKLTRKMDSSLHNARHGVKSLKTAGILNSLKLTRRLSLMRAFETTHQNIKEHKLLKRYFDTCTDADSHIIAMRAFPCLMYDSKGMRGKALIAVHYKLKLHDEVFNYFITQFINVIRLEGYTEEQIVVLRQRLEYFRPMIAVRDATNPFDILKRGRVLPYGSPT
jgi:hypothetical protein